MSKTHIQSPQSVVPEYTDNFWEEIGVIATEMNELSESEITYCTRFLEPIMIKRIEYLLSRLKDNQSDGEIK